MNRAPLWAAACVGAAAVAGCSTPMLSPVYTSDAVVPDPGLAGTWLCEGELRMQAVVAERPGPRYDVDLTVWHRGEEKTRLHLDVRLVRLGESMYGDLYLAADERSDLVGRYGMLAVPVHQVVRYSRDGDSLDMRMLESTWMNRTLSGAGDSPASQRVRTGDEGELTVLTASTGELQRFLEQHADDPGAFGARHAFRRASP
jgi:hypothetical protein